MASVVGQGFTELLRHPSARGMFRNSKVQNASGGRVARSNPVSARAVVSLEVVSWATLGSGITQTSEYEKLMRLTSTSAMKGSTTVYSLSSMSHKNNSDLCYAKIPSAPALVDVIEFLPRWFERLTFRVETGNPSGMTCAAREGSYEVREGRVANATFEEARVRCLFA